MSKMFCGCSSLKSLDLSSFNIKNVNFMDQMFCGCSALESIDLSSFDKNYCHHICDVFAGCSSLKKENVKIKNSETNLLKELERLNNCTKLDIDDK